MTPLQAFLTVETITVALLLALSGPRYQQLRQIERSSSQTTGHILRALRPEEKLNHSVRRILVYDYQVAGTTYTGEVSSSTLQPGQDVTVHYAASQPAASLVGDLPSVMARERQVVLIFLALTSGIALFVSWIVKRERRRLGL